MNNLTLVDLFLNEYWIEKGLSENTVQSYRLDLTALCDWLDKQNLSLELQDQFQVIDDDIDKITLKYNAKMKQFYQEKDLERFYKEILMI